LRVPGLAALFVAMMLSSCGGSREPSSASAPPTDDLSVTQTGPATVAAGSTATFTAVVANGGKTQATNLTITETLTAGYTVAAVNCTPSFGATCPATLGAMMTLPSLSQGHWLTITYQVAVPAGSRGAIVNQVQVTSAEDADLGNNASSFTISAVDARNGTYKAYAADGRPYDLAIDFDAQQYTLSGNGVNAQRSFTLVNGEYVVAGNSRLRVAQDLLVGSHDFGGGPVPYVAARQFATTILDGVYNLATRNVAADGTATTHAGTARIAGNVLSVCQTDTVVVASQDCPVVLTSYLLSVNGDVFTGTETTTGAVFTFQIAHSGGANILLSALTAPDSTQQLRIGLQDSAGLTWGTLYGPTSTGDWITMVLDASLIEYAVLGSTTNDQAGLQKISNSGPFAMMVGTRVSDSADIYVLQTAPLAIMVGAFGGPASGEFQVALP
jgi:uncharacterized repeat protein (TIGR01451 family)